jgi:hypothetical protein
LCKNNTTLSFAKVPTDGFLWEIVTRPIGPAVRAPQPFRLLSQPVAVRSVARLDAWGQGHWPQHQGTGQPRVCVHARLQGLLPRAHSLRGLLSAGLASSNRRWPDTGRLGCQPWAQEVSGHGVVGPRRSEPVGARSPPHAAWPEATPWPKPPQASGPQLPSRSRRR